IILFCGATVTIGQIAVGGCVMLLYPGPPAAWFHTEAGFVRGAGIACLAVIAFYLAAAARVRHVLRIRRWRFALPSLGLAAAQVAAGAVNFLCLAFTLYALLSATQDVTFGAVTAIYLLASIAALISHVPGGLGVVEFILLSFLPQESTWGALI